MVGAKAVKPGDLATGDLRWSSVMLNEVLLRGLRLEASVFDIEGKHAREVLKQCKWPLSKITGDEGLATAYHRPRFKRIWLKKSDLPIYQPSQILELNPKPSGYISSLTHTDINALRVHKGQILLTCSGTIGRCALVSKTLDNRVFSHDLIRINCKKEEDAGFVYAFLKTKIGNALIRTNEYGSVVSHIEPEHLESVPIPNPPADLKKQVHDLVMRSYVLRDESNELLEQAKKLLYESLKLPSLEELTPSYFDSNADLRNYAVKLSELNARFDASYHVPIVDAIMKKLKKEAAELTTIGDPRISKQIILPDRFTRVYVEEGQGTVFFGGKQILQLDPTTGKYLSLAKHDKRIKEKLLLKENIILITRSGTIGKIVLVPSHWEQWVASEDLIRIEPVSKNIAGYTYIFLSTDWGQELVKRFTFGSVQNHIDDHHVSQIPIPLLKDISDQDKINRLALEANKKRTEAYYVEQEAIELTNEILNMK